jgi:hypothetical protein
LHLEPIANSYDQRRRHIGWSNFFKQPRRRWGFYMVTQSAIPDTTNLDQKLEGHARFRPTPETWLGDVTECVVAARAPILVTTVYCVFLLMPDQTAEAIRSTFETTTWESTLWFILVLIFWWLFNFYIVIAFDAATRVALHDLNEKRGKERKLNGTQARIVQAVTLSPVAALWAAFAQSLGPNVLAPLMDWKAILSLLAVTVMAGWPFLKEKDEREGGSPGSNLRMLEGSAILVAFILLLVLAALRIISFFVGYALDPPAVLTFTAWIIILLASLTVLAHWSNKSGAPIISLLVIGGVLLATFDLSDNHVVRTIASSAPEAPQVGAAFDAWINEQDRAREVKKYQESKRNYPVFLIAAEGGGSRAAYMTALVLEALRKNCPDAIRHTFLIVGVSGGSVGALLASAGVKWDEQKLGVGCDGKLELAGPGVKGGPETSVTGAAGVDFLRPVLRGLLFGDIPARIMPSSLFLGATPFFAWWSDPAQYLEIGIDRAWREFDKSNERNQHSLSNTGFRELWTGASSAAPALMLLTTDVTSGRRVAVSHLTTRIATKKLPANSPASKSTCVQEAQDQGLEFRTRLLTLDDLQPGIEVPAATAAVLSARFPGITSPGRLPCSGPARRLVDGGYFENSGLTTVLELLGELRQRPSPTGVSFVVVQIENGRASSDWSFANGERPPPPNGWLPELMSPVRTIIATRQARADIARVELTKSVPSEAECRSQPCDFRVLFELRPCKTPIPLGWSLSEAAQREIRRQLFDPRANGAEQECIDDVPPDRRPPPTDMTNVMRFEQIFRATRTN